MSLFESQDSIRPHVLPPGTPAFKVQDDLCFSIPDQVMTSSSATSSYEDNSVNESQIAGPNIADEEEELMQEEIEEEEENVEVITSSTENKSQLPQRFSD